MSHIPNSAMPHAAASDQASNEGGKGGGSLSERAGRIAEKARENPKTAIAAGAAVLAGAVVAAAIPLARSRGKGGEGTKKGGGKSGSAKKG